MKTLRFFFFLLFLTPTVIYPQISVSDAFQKTIQKLSRERLKKEVIEWNIEKNPVRGIIARDLITQLIDNAKDEQAILRSTANVTINLLYFGSLTQIIDTVLNKHPEFKNIGMQRGMNSTEFMAYTALYYYYSERKKIQAIYLARYIGDEK